MSLKDRMAEEFMEGLKEGFAGKPMEFPEGIRGLGEFQGEGQWAFDPAEHDDFFFGEVSPNQDDEVIDAEVIED